MRNRTITAILDGDRDTVFDFMADIERLPEWATEFARELRRDGDDYKVVNGLGEAQPRGRRSVTPISAGRTRWPRARRSCPAGQAR